MTEGKKSVIEINGNTYDASSGRILTSRQATKSMDIVAPQKPSIKTTPLTPLTRPVAAQASHATQIRKLDKSHTLMRNAVRKPVAITHHNPASVLQTQPSRSQFTQTSNIDNDARMNRAHRVPMSTRVQKFDISPAHTTARLAPMGVTAAPIDHTPHAPKPVIHTTAVAAGSENFIREQLSSINSSTEQESPFKKKPLHKRTTHVIKSHKFASFSAVLASFILLAGFLSYMNMPTIALAMASKKSGLTIKNLATVPKSYKLDRKIYSAPGQVTMSYKTNTDDRRFSITLLKVDQTSDTFREGVATRTKGQYKIYESGGNTIYITTLGGNQADWMKNGVRYSINGNAAFTTEQIASIASGF